MFSHRNERRLSWPVGCRVLCALLVLACSLISGLALMIWQYRFLPGNRWEVAAPAGEHRAFVESVGVFEQCYLLNASDWPWTFTRPFVVADLSYRRELYWAPSSHWTNDGSAVVFVAQRVGESTREVMAGYDFREHRGWGESSGSGSGPGREEMAAWIEARGGLSHDLGYHEFKGDGGGDSLTSPWWILLSPVGALITAGCVMDRILQNTKISTRRNR